MGTTDGDDDTREITRVFTKDDRPLLTQNLNRRSLLGDRIIARKTARVIAIRLHAPFLVSTDHGQMLGSPGDWLVTNHPEDDPSSDVWPVSAERFSRSYEVVPTHDSDGGDRG